MDLLHVINSLDIGGAQKLLSDLIPLQVKQGINVSVAVYKWEDNELCKKIIESGAKIFVLNLPSIKNPIAFLKLRKSLKKFDVIHVHLFPSLYWVAIASIGLNNKFIYTEHSTSNRRRNKPYLRLLERFIYSKYDKIISISESTQNALQNWVGSHDDRFIIINNGVDTKKFASVNMKIIPNSLIMVSRFVASKDQETVIRALKYLDEKVTLSFVGNGENFEHCQKLAANEGVANRVNFLGSKSNIPEIIAQSYIGIQSSNWEGFGLTAVELMAAGKPVIASNVDGLKQVVEGAGIIFKKGDEKDLANKISSILSSESTYISIAEKCRERAQEYDISKMAMLYYDVYKSSLT